MSKINEEAQKFSKMYNDLKMSLESDNNDWNLARSRNREVNEMINHIQTQFKILEKRLKSGKAYCLVFDSKKYTSETVPDALVGEIVSAKLDPEHEYYLKGDKNVKVARIIERKFSKSNEVSKIVVPTDNWSSLKTLRITLSPNRYSEFLKQCQERNYFVDAIIVTLNSVKDFEDTDIKLLLNEIAQKYLDPFIIINDAPDKDCASIKCDICHEVNRKLLLKLIKDENRFAKVSSRAIIHNKSTVWNKYFDTFKRLLEEDVKVETLVCRFFKMNKILMESFREIKKTTSEDKNILIEDTDMVVQKLKDKNEETKKTIDVAKQETVTKLEKKIRTLEDFVNRDFVKDNIDPIIDTQFAKLGPTMFYKILEVIKSNKPEFDNHIANIYVKEYLNKEDTVAKVKKDIEKAKEKILVEEARRLFLSRFQSSTKYIVTNAYDSVNSSFETFVGNIKDNIMGKYHQFQARIKGVVNEVCLSLRKDNKNEIENSITIIKKKIVDKKCTLRLIITVNLNRIISKIKEMRDVNIHPNDITHYLPPSYFISTLICDQIDNELTVSFQTIQKDIIKISKNDLLKEWFKDLSDEYANEYANTYFYKEERFRSQFCDIITNLYRELCANALYTKGSKYQTRTLDQWRNREARIGGEEELVGGAVGSVVPIVGNVVAGAIGDVWGAFGGKKETKEVMEERTNEGMTKTIKEKEMIIKVDDIAKLLKTISDSIIDDISESFKGFFRRKNLLI